MIILPNPQKVKYESGFFFASYDTEIVIAPSCQEIVYQYALLLQNSIAEETGFTLNIYRGQQTESSIVMRYCKELKEQVYVIKVTERTVYLISSGREGMLYAIQSLRQIIQQYGARIPCMEIEDFPEFKTRGLYYDVTRCRIPTVEYLKSLIDQLSFYKINQFQLYIEHTYMFRNLSEMWRDDTPITSAEILELDKYCSERNIELVPSIATFGHLYKLLRTKSYRHLCEFEELCDEPYEFVSRMEHHTIDITNEESFRLITSMIDEYISLFQSGKFNICGDETMDLGRGKGKNQADDIGISEMYIRYVSRLCEYLIEKGKTPMFWGDIISRFPEKIADLPEETICLNWGYDADVKEDSTKKLSQAGAILYNCPGVSGWDQFINRMAISYANIKKMCEYGHKYNAIGILNTDWGDCGHVNHPDMGYVGMIYGACFSWNSDIPTFDEINREISIIGYRDMSGKIVSMLAELSELWKFKWRDLIDCKERRMGQTFHSDLKDLEEAEHILKKRKEELLGYIASMDGKKKGVIRPYIIAVDGMVLLQKIGRCLLKQGMTWEKQDIDESCQAQIINTDYKQLAAELEKWFYNYKEEWRKVSKEGELYRVAEVIYWTADQLRSI